MRLRSLRRRCNDGRRPPRRRGSSTPRLIGSSLRLWILDRPPSLTTTRVFAISRRIAPEVCIFVSALSKLEGAGKTGCTLHPRSRVQLHTENAHTSIQVQAETLRPSLRNGFTAYFVLSPVNGSFATVAYEKLRFSGLNASTAASGPHDFAVRSGAHVSRASRVHRISPHVRDDRERPSSAVRRAELCR